MHGTRKYLSFLFLTAALTTPIALSARAAQEVIIQHEGDHTRYYDRGYHDYHEWNGREDHSYRIYLGEHHREYREFHTNNSHEQRNYWKWRHHHPDHD